MNCPVRSELRTMFKKTEVPPKFHNVSELANITVVSLLVHGSDFSLALSTESV